MATIQPITNIIFDFGGVVLDIDPTQTLNELKKLGFEDVGLLENPAFKEDIMNKFERGILTPETFRKKVRNFFEDKSQRSGD